MALSRVKIPRLPGTEDEEDGDDEIGSRDEDNDSIEDDTARWHAEAGSGCYMITDQTPKVIRARQGLVSVTEVKKFMAKI